MMHIEIIHIFIKGMFIDFGYQRHETNQGKHCIYPSPFNDFSILSLNQVEG